uniref:Peptidase M3A/M3B catalytic domain-containing protein n=1 Tax=Clastoptera arizonana TaxID=38151 RepID=A0A1B6E4N2_9HEMI
MAVSLCCRRLKFNLNKCRLIQPYRNGYIVLLPEINNEVTEQADLLKNGLPDFKNLETENCLVTVGQHLLNLEHGVRVIEENIEKDGIKNIVSDVLEPLEKLAAPLNSSWGIVKTLYLTNQKFMPASKYLNVHDRARRARSGKYYSKTIYNACKECDASKVAEEENRVIGKYLLEGRLSGLELSDTDRVILAKTRNVLAEEKAKYNTRVEASSKVFSHTIGNHSIIRDFPEHLLKAMSLNREEPSKGPWEVTLKPQVTTEFFEYCPDSDLRWNVWQAATRVASSIADNSEFHNSSCLEKIRSLRRDEARVLGYPTYADMSMETKMVGTLSNAEDTLANLLQKAKISQDKEISNLQNFAWERGFEGLLQLWDVPYWQRKEKRTLYNFDEEVLRDYFPIEKVLSGLMALCESLFGLKFVENTNIDKWHPDVRFFYIFEDDLKKPVAGFYIDPYERDYKVNLGQNTAWMVGISPAARIYKNLPLAAIVCNFNSPLYGKPSLLSFSNVKCLFKKFGHMLQHVLSTGTYADVSGLNNVEWDAVGICSNFMTHWLYDKQVIESISGHYAKDEKLPEISWSQLQQHMAGFNLCEELFKAQLDLELYSTKTFWLDIVRRLWPQHYIFPLDKWYAMPCSFKPIVSEEWAAGYFSHVWAELVAADVYSAFKEDGANVENIGIGFRDTFLAFGGGCHPSEVFRRFRGRDPSPNAYLTSLGLMSK